MINMMLFKHRNKNISERFLQGHSKPDLATGLTIEYYPGL